MTRGGVNGNKELLVTDSPGIKIRNKRDSKKKKKESASPPSDQSVRIRAILFTRFLSTNENEFPEKVKCQVHVQNTDDITDSRRSMEAAEGNEILFKRSEI